ncbi:MAG: PIN domain nuclease [Mycobacterium sp.]
MKPLTASLVDTDVFSLVYVKKSSADTRVPGWKLHLTSRRVLISFQTRAEVLSGARSAGWGNTRMTQLMDILDRMPTIYSDDDVVDAYATLGADCRRIGHALHGREHSGDRWIAACAIAKGLQLVAGDAIYNGAPNLDLFNSTSNGDVV